MDLEAEVFAPEECHKILWIQVENPLVSICSRESPECCFSLLLLHTY